MRRKSLLALALGVVVAGSFTAIAAAKWSVFQAGNLVLKADGGVSPKALPKKAYAPVTVNIKGQISTKDGTHAPAVREVVIDFDKNGKIDTTGYPTCKGGQLEARNTADVKKVCGTAVVGKGNGNIEVAFAEQKPIPIRAPITVFNGGTKGGKTTLYIHTFITVPAPTAVVTTVTIKKISKGRYGLNTVSKIPKIAGGFGSVLSFDIDFHKIYTHKGKKKSYFTARCVDGKFHANVLKSEFVEEATGSGVKTDLKGLVIRPCTPKG